MASNSRAKKGQRSNVVGAGAAGGSIGTLIASFAENLPDDNPYKSSLIVASPIIAVGISGVWLFVKTAFVDPFAAAKKHKSTHAHIQKLLSDARKTEDAVMKNPNSTEKHKKEVRSQVEKLEKLLLENIVENVEYA